MSLNILRGKKPPNRISRDVYAFQRISPDKLPIILEVISNYVIDRKPLSVELIQKLAEKTETTDRIVMAAISVLTLIARNAPAITKEELRDDLRKLKLDNETIDHIVNFIETEKVTLYDFAKRTREEAVPNLLDINWRVDIRHASGDFLKEPTVYALIRVQVSDGQEVQQVYIELDKDDLSWLETTINKMKAKFIEAEKIKATMYKVEQS